MLAKAVARRDAGDGRGGVEADAQPGSDPGREEMRGDDALSQHHRPARADERAAAAQPSVRRRQGHHRLDPRRHPARFRRRLYRHQSGERRSGRDRRAVAAARRHHRAAANSDPGLRADPCDDHARVDRAGVAGRSGVPVDRGDRGRQPQFRHRPGAAATGAPGRTVAAARHRRRQCDVFRDRAGLGAVGQRPSRRRPADLRSARLCGRPRLRSAAGQQRGRLHRPGISL